MRSVFNNLQTIVSAKNIHSGKLAGKSILLSERFQRPSLIPNSDNQEMQFLNDTYCRIELSKCKYLNNQDVYLAPKKSLSYQESSALQDIQSQKVEVNFDTRNISEFRLSQFVNQDPLIMKILEKKSLYEIYFTCQNIGEILSLRSTYYSEDVSV